MGHYLCHQLFHIWCSSHLPCTGLWWNSICHSVQCLWCRGIPSTVHSQVHRIWGVDSKLPYFQFLLFSCYQGRSEMLWWSVVHMLNFSAYIYITLVVVHAAVWCMCAVLLHYNNWCGYICVLMVCNITWKMFVYMEKEVIPEVNGYITCMIYP